MLGLAQTTIANYEQGKRFPDEETLLKIADFFNVSMDYLFGRSEIKSFSEDFSHRDSMQLSNAFIVYSPTLQLYIDTKERKIQQFIFLLK